VGSRDFLGVIGPNGGGKTTLLRLILGLIKPINGQVLYFPPPEAARLRMGYLPQYVKFDPEFPITAGEVVLSGAKRGNKLFFIDGRQKQRARELLAWVGLGHVMDQGIGSLSGGQRQRVFLCRALFNEPDLLILDEPETHVDSAFEGFLLDKLVELNNRMAIILVSHDLGMVSSYVRTIACVNETLHYHTSNVITKELLDAYHCPIDLIAHGTLPHRVLLTHDNPHAQHDH
jgi:zinc transport system ATP-binding protein